MPGRVSQASCCRGAQARGGHGEGIETLLVLAGGRWRAQRMRDPPTDFLNVDDIDVPAGRPPAPAGAFPRRSGVLAILRWIMLLPPARFIVSGLPDVSRVVTKALRKCG